MNRRQFSKSALALAGGLSLGAGKAFAQDASSAFSPASAKGARGGPFQLNYAPSFRHFKNLAGKDPIEVIRFMHDQGFRGIEDNGMMNKPVDVQIKIGKELERLGMTMGVFVMGFGFNAPNFAGNRPDANKRKRDPQAVREMIKKGAEEAIECAKRVNAKWTTVVPGAEDPSLEPEYQFQNVVDNLKYASELLEPAGLIMVLEPLNHMNHPGLFLKRIPQAYAICKAVGSSSCKILNDLYHQQISEGNLIPNIDRAWDEIAYFQVGDNPGRKEPTTGEINYKNIFEHLHRKGYKGIIGMEHGMSQPGADGERRLIQAYREVDSF